MTTEQAGGTTLTASTALPVRTGGKPDPPATVRAWLASAHDIPPQAYREWATEHVALLRLGRRFGVVRIPGELLHAVAGRNNGETVQVFVQRELGGPVICDYRTGPTYYCLVPWWPGIYWPVADVPLLGAGVYLGVPDIGRIAGPGSFWVNPPAHYRHLCPRETVFDVIVKAKQVVGERDGEVCDGVRSFS